MSFADDEHNLQFKMFLRAIIQANIINIKQHKQIIFKNINILIRKVSFNVKSS